MEMLANTRECDHIYAVSLSHWCDAGLTANTTPVATLPSATFLELNRFNEHVMTIVTSVDCACYL